MANITNELNAINNAVYGKDVRQAIHDGISKINVVSEQSDSRSNDAAATANNAATVANNASTAASNAVTTANSALTKATSAVTTANNAASTATAASSSASASAASASTAVTNANAAVTAATNAKNAAETAATSANTAAVAANAAAFKLEGMTASATETTGAPSVSVTTVNGHYNAAFTLPRGTDGVVGDIGAAMWSVAVNAQGDLILSYPDGADAPPLSINASGDLIYTTD